MFPSLGKELRPIGLGAHRSGPGWRSRAAHHAWRVPRKGPAPALLLVALAGVDLGARLPASGARALIVLPPALLAPGAALCCALFGRDMPLRGLPRPVLWIMMSMAIYPLLALCLQMGGYPITAANALRGLNALILLLLAIYAMRIGLLEQRPAGHAHAPPSGRPVREPGRGRHIRVTVVNVGLVLGLGPVVGVALVLLPKPAPTPYSQVALDGPWADLHAVARSTDGRLHVRLRITNHTGHTITYRVDPAVDGARWVETTVSLASGATWTGVLSGGVPADGAVHRLRIAVYAPGDRGVKALTLWAQDAAQRTGRAGIPGHAPRRAMPGALPVAAISPAMGMVRAANDDQPFPDRRQPGGQRR